MLIWQRLSCRRRYTGRWSRQLVASPDVGQVTHLVTDLISGADRCQLRGFSVCGRIYASKPSVTRVSRAGGGLVGLFWDCLASAR